MPCTSRQYFEFDDFRVDVENRVLLQHGRAVPLNPRTFDVLVVLAGRAGQTVDKNSLLNEVWADTFVEEGNLNRHISTLRRVLGDSPSEQRLIKTIPKLGYRFTADVRHIEAVEPLIFLEEVSRERITVHEETVSGFWTFQRVAVAGVITISAALLVGWAVSGGRNRVASERPMSSDIEAVEAYEKGRSLWKNRSAQSLHEATLLLERAVNKDPGFALAHSALADAYAFDYGNWQRAEGHARLALGLDPTLGEPYATLGFIKMHWQWRVADAEADLKTAIELSPDYAIGHQWYALDLAARIRVDAAMAEVRKAVDLEPRSASIISDQCHIQYLARRYEDALASCNKALDIDPGLVSAHLYLEDIYSALGMNEEAVNKFIETRSLLGSEVLPADAAVFRTAFSVGGIDGFRRAQVNFLVRKESSFFAVAKAYARLGDKANALKALASAADRREWDLLYLGDPVFIDYRFDPEYTRIAALMQIERTQ